MKLLRDTFKNTGDLHHAYLLEGEKDVIRKNLLEFIQEELKHPTQGNPDFWHEQFETLSIDDARKLRELQSMKPIVHPRKIFIVETFGMTVEAQNALLKIFEEPTPGTHFFVISPSADLLLPTLRSRMIVIVDEERSETGKSTVKKFLAVPLAERLKIVEDIIETKDKAAASVLIDGLIVELSKKNRADYASVLEQLLEMRTYIADRSPSLKLILEHIAITTPTGK